MKSILEGFTISGEAGDCTVPRLVRDVIAFLDASPNLKLYTMRALADGIKRSEDRMHKFSGFQALAPYRHMTPQGRVYWGSIKTIQELKRRLK